MSEWCGVVYNYLLEKSTGCASGVGVVWWMCDVWDGLILVILVSVWLGLDVSVCLSVSQMCCVVCSEC